ncbi:hypothetical protein ACQRAW_10755 [Fusicatenibacter saccharivorans]|uniref:hypothetical protein n=1 Tax=Fusicatenibacter saccharivorans TaxID=1150298 RepID=UPI003CFFD10A
MKFITENDLRAQFNEQPFTDFRIEENTRLTPGARQFLSDRRIQIIEAGKNIQSVRMTEEREKPAPEHSLAAAKLISQIEILEAEFLVLTSQIIEEDIEIAGQISKIGREFGRIKSMITEDIVYPESDFSECTGIKQSDCGRDLGNCFEISDLYIQSSNGKLLVQLNALRAKIRALRVETEEILCNSQDEECLTEVTANMNRIVNKVSQLICMAAGVKECRKIQ